MEAHISIHLKLPPSSLRPGAIWVVSEEQDVSILEYISSTCTCRTQLSESHGAKEEEYESHGYVNRSGRKYRRLRALKKLPGLQLGLVDWEPVWEASGKLGEGTDHTGFTSGDQDPAHIECSAFSRILGSRLGSEGPEHLVQWSPTWEELETLEARSVEEFQKNHQDILSLLGVVEAVVDGVQGTGCPRNPQ
ncbi:uncharacterized protein ATNIH1004_001876 [Aspergillus tanneri]|uniref:Uncharacterized protein n=1 Tax=Aspergillus tanneri TaxID=1220188 RepID=A0A5M9M3X9_9EURO|nr:uncharacterized protein ATNIH1004_001876 [Aspergillus tanneri]KAA8641411.1 hypothetical protein ATNIH1004_001876 [Aspergillus tanneri]